ncbi:MAG: hypothetical protein MK100_07920 [Phycisphaerales bacterium]|nr:hypothetical protein [Phycisphaerales bacterium]
MTQAHAHPQGVRHHRHAAHTHRDARDQRAVHAEETERGGGVDHDSNRRYGRPILGAVALINCTQQKAMPWSSQKILLKAGANPNAQSKDAGRTALHEAVVQQHPNSHAILVLLAAGANPTIEDFQGESAWEATLKSAQLGMLRLSQEGWQAMKDRYQEILN